MAPYSSALFRRAPVAALAIVLAVTTTSCGSDPDPDANPAVGQREIREDIKALGMALVTNGEGAARVVGTLVNEAEEPDRLIGVDVVTELGAFDVIVADGPVILPPDEPVRLAREAEMTLFSEVLRPGYRADVRLLFRNAEPLITTLPVERQEGVYAEVEVMLPPDGDITPEEVEIPLED